MLISSKEQLKALAMEQIIRPLMEFLANKIEAELKNNLDEAPISTETLQEYVTHTIEKKTQGYTMTVWIDSALAQSQRAGTKTWYKNGIIYVQFMSLDGSESYGGQPIVSNIINWLEETGVTGEIGNNPFAPISMFYKTGQTVKTELNSWLKEYKG